MIEHFHQHQEIYIAGIIGLFTAYLSLRWGRSMGRNDKLKEDAIRYIGYRVTNSQNILANIVSKGMTMKINDLEVKSVGIIDIWIYNHTDRDYDTLSFIINIKSNHPKKEPFVLSLSYEDVNGGQERITLEDLSNNQSLHRYKLTLNHANRFRHPILHATIIAVDIENVKCVVDMHKTGLELKKYSVRENWESLKPSPRTPPMSLLTFESEPKEN